jgi:hypothetical protein
MIVMPDPTSPPPHLQSLNRYAYVTNNPVNYIDPSGYFHRHKKQSGGFWDSIFGTILRIVFDFVMIWAGLPPGGLLLEGATIGLSAFVGLADLMQQGISALNSGGNDGMSGGDSPISGVPGSINAGGGGFFSPALQRAQANSPLSKDSLVYSNNAPRGCTLGDDFCSMGPPPLVVADVFFFGRIPTYIKINPRIPKHFPRNLKGAGRQSGPPKPTPANEPAPRPGDLGWPEEPWDAPDIHEGGCLTYWLCPGGLLPPVRAPGGNPNLERYPIDLFPPFSDPWA